MTAAASHYNSAAANANANAAANSAQPHILLRKSNRGMLAITKPDPTVSTTLQWYCIIILI